MESDRLASYYRPADLQGLPGKDSSALSVALSPIMCRAMGYLMYLMRDRLLAGEADND